MFKKYRQWLKEKKRREEMSAGNKEYLLNTFADIALLRDVINGLSKDPDLHITIRTLDGTVLDLSYNDKNIRKVINWDKE